MYRYFVEQTDYWFNYVFNQIMLIFYYCAVELRYNEVLEIMRIALYLVSHCVRAKKLRNIRCIRQWNCLVVRGLCYIRPLCSEVPLYYPLQACFLLQGKIFIREKMTAFFMYLLTGEIGYVLHVLQWFFTVVISIHLLYAKVWCIVIRLLLGPGTLRPEGSGGCLRFTLGVIVCFCWADGCFLPSRTCLTAGQIPSLHV